MIVYQLARLGESKNKKAENGPPTFKKNFNGQHEDTNKSRVR